MCHGVAQEPGGLVVAASQGHGHEIADAVETLTDLIASSIAAPPPAGDAGR